MNVRPTATTTTPTIATVTKGSAGAGAGTGTGKRTGRIRTCTNCTHMPGYLQISSDMWLQLRVPGANGTRYGVVARYRGWLLSG